MPHSHLTIIADLAILALFLISVAASRYAIQSDFARTRFVMSALFFYIVISLSISYWSLALRTLPFAVPAFLIGLLLGELVGVRTERQKLFMHGLEGYMERFAHISHKDVQNLTWWSFINFYSVTCVLILINLIGFTTVILDRSAPLAILTSVVGAALIGSILPYLAHLWRLPAATQAQETGSAEEAL
jgi:hypothetical protein